MVARIESFDLGPFVPGMDNRRPETKMKGSRSDGGDFLRSAVNVNVSSTGTIKRRSGYASILAGTDCHSFWADGADAFFVDGQTLNRITGLPGNAIAVSLRTGLAPGRSMSYVRAPRAVYYSNGVTIGRITAAGVSGVSTPPLTVPPTAAATGDGALGAGRYGLCFTHRDASGEESASTAPIWADVADRQSIVISGLAALPAGAAALIVYMTLPNDSIFQTVRSLTAPPSQITVAVQESMGARCSTLQLAPMPAGDIVRLHYGRLLVAAGSVLFYSEPYMLGLMNPTRGFIQFPAPITIVEPTSGGVWLCADHTYWLPGKDIGDLPSLDSKLPYGGVRGTGSTRHDMNDVIWMSPRGVMRGSDSGEVKNLQEAHVAVASAAFGAGYFRESDGYKQMGESLFAVDPNRMAASSYMDAEVIRKGVTL